MIMEKINSIIKEIYTFISLDIYLNNSEFSKYPTVDFILKVT